jgi:putative membrane protein
MARSILQAVIAVLVCFASLVAPTYSADLEYINQPPEPPVLKITPSPGDFATRAAEGGMAVVQLSLIAQERTDDLDVRSFAARMITDHRELNAKLKTLAESEGIALPKALSNLHDSSLRSLRGESKQRFDNAYIALMKRYHLNYIALFNAATRAEFDNAALKGFAIRALPTLREHMDDARVFPKAIRGQKSTSDGTAPQVAPESGIPR